MPNPDGERHALCISVPGAVAALAVAAWLSACGPSEGQNTEAGALPVEVSPPVSKTIVEWDEYTGRFEAIETVEIRARVSGYLDSIHFEDGQIVDRGDLLFVIDPRPYQAILDEAQAQLEQALARQELAAMELKRGERLLQNQTISQETFDERQQTKRAADASVAAAEAMVRAAELNLEFTRIRSPVTGRVSDHFVSIGNLVSGGNENATLLTTVVSLDPIHFVFDASESDYLRYVRLDQTGERPASRTSPHPVFLRLIDEAGFEHEGKMNFIDNRIDQNTGTMRGRAIFDNKELLFTPGMFGRIRLAGSAEYRAILLPDRVILSDQSRKFVWVVNDENLVEYRSVRIGPLVDGMRVVREGVGPEDRIIVGNLLRVRQGMTVAPDMTPIEMTLVTGG